MKYLLLLVIVAVPFAIYIYHWLKKLICLIHTGEERRARVVKTVVTVVMTAILTILSINILSMIGIVLLHFWVISALWEFTVWIVGRMGHLRKGHLEKGNLKKGHQKASRVWTVINRFSLIPLLVVSVFMIYGAWNMSHVVKKEYTVRTEKPIRSEGYTILLLTDTHYGSVQNTDVLKDIIDELNAINPDIVILGGDIVEEGTSVDELEEVFGLLGGLNNNFGIYYVYGNHDMQPYTDKRTYTDTQLKCAIDENGIIILDNEYVQIADDIILVGRGNSAWGNVLSRPSVAEIIGGDYGGRLVIVADHQPVESVENAAAGADIQLSGHTHGGQIWPIGIFTELAGGLNYGAYVEGGNHVFVSSGVAGWCYPVRTGKHCEYVVVRVEGD